MHYANRQNSNNHNAGPPEGVAESPIHRRNAPHRRFRKQGHDGIVTALAFSNDTTVRVADSEHALVRRANHTEPLLNATKNSNTSVILGVAHKVPRWGKHRIDPLTSIPSREAREAHVFADRKTELTPFQIDDDILLTGSISHFEKRDEMLLRVLSHHLAVTVEEPRDVVPIRFADASQKLAAMEKESDDSTIATVSLTWEKPWTNSLDKDGNVIVVETRSKSHTRNSLGTEMKVAENCVEEIRNKNQMAQTAFEQIDKKTNETMNTISRVLRALGEMRQEGAGKRGGL